MSHGRVHAALFVARESRRSRGASNRGLLVDIARAFCLHWRPLVGGDTAESEARTRLKKVWTPMARRAKAREILERSRVLLDRSRVAAAQLLDPPRYDGEGTDGTAIAAYAQPLPAHGGEQQQALVDMCANLALRDLNLVDTLLSELEKMETGEEDEERLEQLYRLDHLATRLRRNAENLRVLAGRDAGGPGSDASSLVDIVRGAMSSIDQYARVTIGRVVSLGVVGFAAEDISRLLAELLDNAANQSPPTAPVRVSAHLTETGSVLMRIEDEGIGLPEERLDELNRRLSPSTSDEV